MSWCFCRLSTTTSDRSSKPSLHPHCFCHPASFVAISDATDNPSSLCHRVVAAVAEILTQPLPQIHICAATVAVAAIMLSLRRHPAVASKQSLHRRHRCFLEISAASLPPLPTGPVSRVFSATFSAVLPLLFLLLTLPPSQIHSKTVL